MTVHSGPRAAYWFGKHVTARPFSKAGNDDQGRDGRISMSERWFSDEWWRGHHDERNSDGEFAPDTTGRTASKKRASWGGSTYQRTRAPQDRAANERDARTEYAGYMADREKAARTATHDYMVTAAGRAKGYSGGDFFDTDASHRPGRKYMTDELRSWMGDADTATGRGNGRGLMTYAQWTKQSKQSKKEKVAA